jgi:hypothetical protein
MEQAAHLDLEPKEPLCGVREPSSCSPRNLLWRHAPKGCSALDLDKGTQLGSCERDVSRSNFFLQMEDRNERVRKLIIRLSGSPEGCYIDKLNACARWRAS